MNRGVGVELNSVRDGTRQCGAVLKNAVAAAGGLSAGASAMCETFGGAAPLPSFPYRFCAGDGKPGGHGAGRHGNARSTLAQGVISTSDTLWAARLSEVPKTVC